MALILFGFGNTTARPFHCRNADMFDCGYSANHGIAGLFLKPAKTSRSEYQNTRARSGAAEPRGKCQASNLPASRHMYGV
jgi:hypothetical protein